MIIFADSRDPIVNSRDPNRVPKTPLKNPACINLLALRLPLLVNTTPRYLNFSTCCSVLRLTCRIHCLGFIERHSLGICSADFHFGSVARGRKPIECMLKTVEKMLAVPNRLQKVNG